MRLTIGAVPGGLPTVLERNPGGGWTIQSGIVGSPPTTNNLPVTQVVDRLVEATRANRILVTQDLSVAGLSELVGLAARRSSWVVLDRLRTLLSR